MRFLAVAGFVLLAAMPVQASPKVVELFQSQGCSSCPPAIANVNAHRRPGLIVLALMFAVTYWDRLGWKDTFGKPDNTPPARPTYGKTLRQRLLHARKW